MGSSLTCMDEFSLYVVWSVGCTVDRWLVFAMVCLLHGRFPLAGRVDGWTADHGMERVSRFTWLDERTDGWMDHASITVGSAGVRYRGWAVSCITLVP